jgi:hypothetical protein
MDYKQAKDIRKQSFGTLLAEQEGGAAASFKKALSLKTQAKMTGLKETFDPMNIAKKMTFGSNFAPAMVGKLFGAKQENINYFTGAKKKSIDKPLDGPADVADMSTPSDVLGLIYRLMLRVEEDKKTQLEEEMQRKEGEQKEEDDFYNELLTAITGRKKGKEKKEKVEKEKPEPQEKPKKETPKKEQPKQTTKKEQPKETPKKEQPRDEKGRFTKAEKVETPKPPTKGITQRKLEPLSQTSVAPSTAVKVGGAAALAGGTLLMPTQSVANVIDKASNTVGVDKALMYAMAKQESGFNEKAAATTSSAKGLYQFISGTWKSMVDKYGSKYPILKEKGPEDAEANAIAGALFIKENSDYLRKNNIPVNATTVYAAHFLGPGGAKTLLTANPDANAVQLMPKAASANKFIFYETSNGKVNTNKPKTVQQVVDTLFQKVGQYEQKYSQVLNLPNQNRIEVASKENKEMKENLVKDKATNIQVATSIENTKKSSTVGMVNFDDTNPYLLKARIG